MQTESPPREISSLSRAFQQVDFHITNQTFDLTELKNYLIYLRRVEKNEIPETEFHTFNQNIINLVNSIIDLFPVKGKKHSKIVKLLIQHKGNVRSALVNFFMDYLKKTN